MKENTMNKTAPKVTKTKATDPVAAAAKEPTVKLVLTAQQFNTIMAGLGELPHKAVGQLISDLVEQVRPQVSAKQSPDPVAPAND